MSSRKPPIVMWRMRSGQSDSLPCRHRRDGTLDIDPRHSHRGREQDRQNDVEREEEAQRRIDRESESDQRRAKAVQVRLGRDCLAIKCDEVVLAGDEPIDDRGAHHRDGAQAEQKAWGEDESPQ
jgi:hypothetical protein